MKSELRLHNGSLTCDNLIMQITNFSKRCGWQQRVINAFSLLKKATELITFSDGKKFHIDKMKFLSVKNSID